MTRTYTAKQLMIAVILTACALVLYDFVSTSEFVGAQSKSTVWVELASDNTPSVALMRFVTTSNTADTSIWLGPNTPSFVSCRIHSIVDPFGAANVMYRLIAEVAIDTLNPISYDSTTRIKVASGANLQSLTMNNATYIRFIGKIDGGTMPDSVDLSVSITFDNSEKNLVGI